MRASHAAIALALGAAAGGGPAAGQQPPAGAADAAAGRVVLRWRPVPGAAAYDLQVAADPAFLRRLVDVRVELAGHRLGPPTPERRYWRVRTVDPDGRPGPWSTPRVIEGMASPSVEPEPVPLDVPPVPPAALGVPSAVDAEPSGAAPERGARVAEDDPAAAWRPPRSRAVERALGGEVLRGGRVALLAGWRFNLLGVDAPTVAVEGRWPLPWLGRPWSGALRAGWWRERASLPEGSAAALPSEATADVVPLSVVLCRSFPLRRARGYAGLGAGADLVVVRVGDRGALEASAAAHGVAGAGRRLGTGELFGELAIGLGGVDGPLGRLRTGGIGLSVGYRFGT